jgi:putative ABC transport system ATP-binding protein
MVLKGINYSIKSATFNVILGQSGSGKSTLMNILSGLMKPSRGRVVIEDKDIYGDDGSALIYLRRNTVSNIFQNYLLMPDLTSVENIRLGESEKGFDRDFFQEVLELLGIEKLQDHFPNMLSGGQQQRLAIARAVIKKPRIIFCDEATGALDEENSKSVVALLHKIKKLYSTSIVFTTHNTKIGKTADRITVLRDGAVSEDYANNNPVAPDNLDWGVEI